MYRRKRAYAGDELATPASRSESYAICAARDAKIQVARRAGMSGARQTNR